MRTKIWIAGGLLALGLSFGLTSPVLAVDDPDIDGDGYPASVDCNDNDPSVHPDASEICNGVDDNCSGVIDDVVYPDDPNDGIDNNMDGQIDEGYGFCLFATTGPANECKTAGRLTCVAGAVTCTNKPGNPVIQWSEESLSASGSCTDGSDNDCDTLVDIKDPDCQQPEICDSQDNDGDGFVDERFSRRSGLQQRRSRRLRETGRLHMRAQSHGGRLQCGRW